MQAVTFNGSSKPIAPPPDYWLELQLARRQALLIELGAIENILISNKCIKMRTKPPKRKD